MVELKEPPSPDKDKKEVGFDDESKLGGSGKRKSEEIKDHWDMWPGEYKINNNMGGGEREGDDQREGGGWKMGMLGAWFCGSKKQREEEMQEIERASSQDDGSQYSLSENVLPSLGAKSSRRVALRGYIVSPFDPRYRTWEFYLVFLVFYTAWVSPIEFGFLQKPVRLLAITDNIVNAFFFVDIVLTFFVAYLDRTTYLLVDDKKKIAWKYVRTWFFLDVVSTIPSELAEKIVPNNMQFYGLFNMLRLWRLRRVSKMFSEMEKDRHVDYLFIRAVKLFLVTLFSVHCAACFYYYIGATYADPQRTWFTLVNNFEHDNIGAKYITSVYWSITTLTTTGYGDLHGVNAREMLFITCYMFFNLGLNSYIIGNMTNLVVHGTTRTRHFRDSIEAASSFAQRNSLPVRLQEQMISHISLKYRTDSEGLQQQEIFESLPKAIRSSIANHLFYSVLDQVYLFKGVSNDLLFQLVSEMRPEYFPPREDVILRNEAPTDLYAVVTGAVEIIALKNGGEQVMTEARKGDIFGEIGVLCCRPQLFTARTKRLCQLLRLNRSAFLNLVQANVGDGAIIMSNLLEHLKEMSDPLMQSVLVDIENMLARGRMDLPLTVGFAASRCDQALLSHLLRRGSDPNETDSSGRSALHTVAANGNENCAVLLLDNGANPNIKDSEGNVPLWEAIINGHRSILKILQNNGALLPQSEMGQYACQAAEQNNLELLKDFAECNGDVTAARNNGTTALHIAVSEGYIDMIKFLLDQGADPDISDIHGWTPRGLADYHGNEEVIAILQEKEGGKGKNVVTSPPSKEGRPLHLKKLKPVEGQESARKTREVTWSARPPRRRVNSFRNSFFSVVSSAARGESVHAGDTEGGTISTPFINTLSTQTARVVVKCPEKGEGSKLMFLPDTIPELLELGGKKFECSPTKVLTSEGAEIEDIDLIRDGDQLVLVTDNNDQDNVT